MSTIYCGKYDRQPNACHHFARTCEWINGGCFTREPEDVAKKLNGTLWPTPPEGMDCALVYNDEPTAGYVCWPKDEDDDDDGAEGSGNGCANAINIFTGGLLKKSERVVTLQYEDGSKVCHDAVDLLRFWEMPDTRAVEYEPREPHIMPDLEGYGSRPALMSPLYFKEPQTGVFIHAGVRRAILRGADVVRVARAPGRVRLGNINGVFGVSMLHGQAPGEIIVVEAPLAGQRPTQLDPEDLLLPPPPTSHELLPTPTASSRRRLSGRLRLPDVPEDTAMRCTALRSNADDVAAVLGEGNFGRVVRQPFDGVMRAVKYTRDGDLMHEAALMRIAFESHRDAAKHVARVFAACPLAVSSSQPYSMAMVMEDMAGGSLYQHDRDWSITSPLYKPDAYGPTDVVAVRAAAQLLAGLAYLHTAGVYHRDIKGPNVALTSHDPDTFVIKYIDFGVACVADRQDPAPCALQQGTPIYMPPELVDDDAVQYLTENMETLDDFYMLMMAHDLWALGTTLACFASGYWRKPSDGVILRVTDRGIRMSRIINLLEEKDAHRLRLENRPEMAGVFSVAAAMVAASPRRRLKANDALEELRAVAPDMVDTALANL